MLDKLDLEGAVWWPQCQGRARQRFPAEVAALEDQVAVTVIRMPLPVGGQQDLPADGNSDCPLTASWPPRVKRVRGAGRALEPSFGADFGGFRTPVSVQSVHPFRGFRTPRREEHRVALA